MYESAVQLLCKKLQYMILKFILDNQLENARTALIYSYKCKCKYLN